MKTIGLIGGLTWHSTADYYRLLNEIVAQRLGGPNSAKILMYSVNFAEIKALTFKDDWAAISSMMCDVAKRLEKAGAGCLMLGANTMHNVASDVQAAIDIPLIHIAETTAKAITKMQLKRVALLGTKYTMEMGFYQEKLSAQGINTIIPGDAERAYINNAIYEEMSVGKFLAATKEKFLLTINKLVEEGAEGIVLGCTEIPILIKQTDCSVPIFDTGFFHAEAAVDFALS